MHIIFDFLAYVFPLLIAIGIGLSIAGLGKFLEWNAKKNQEIAYQNLEQSLKEKLGSKR